MLIDIATVLRKELNETLFPDGRLVGSARNVAVFLGISGLWFPLQRGPAWFTSWTTLIPACFPLIVVLYHAADAFAGERERHTLETLLASRLDDRAILIGKILAIVLYAWGLVVASLPIALVALNVANRGAGLLLYRPVILLSILVLGLLVGLLFCTIGVVASLAAPTVRSASQRMLVPFFMVFAVPACMPWLLRKMHWEGVITRVHPEQIVVAVAAGCAVVAGAALAIGLRRFRRERLVLA